MSPEADNLGAHEDGQGVGGRGAGAGGMVEAGGRSDDGSGVSAGAGQAHEGMAGGAGEHADIHMRGEGGTLRGIERGERRGVGKGRGLC
jgi:hypothetical protein